MYIFVSVLIIIASLLLVLIVLVQNSKGGGLAANFSSGGQSFGTRQTTDFLEKSTWTLIATVFLLCLVATAVIPDANVRDGRSAVQQGLQNVVDPTTRPAFPDAMAPGIEATEGDAATTTTTTSGEQQEQPSESKE